MAVMYQTPQAVDAIGGSVNATAEFYAVGTTTAKNVYSDEALNVSLGNSITANDVGVFPAVYLGDGDYRLLVKVASVQVHEIAKVSSVDTSTLPEIIEDIEENTADIAELYGLNAANTALGATNATSIAANTAQITTNTAAITAGTLGYQTKALMDADLTPAADTVARVVNDSVALNNGIFIKSGATGAGSWVRYEYTEGVTNANNIATNTVNITALTITQDSMHPLPVDADYFVAPDGDDSADGLTMATAWATITHAVHEAGETGDSDIVVIGGDYFEEGVTAERWNLNGYTINVYAFGQVNIRMSESLAWSAHAWLFAGTTGTLRFYGGMGKRQFFFDGGFRGTAGTPNTTRAFFGCNNKAHTLEFHDIIYDANGENARLIGSSGIVGAVRFYRSELKNIGTYIGYVRGGFLEIYSCYLTNITNTKICFGNMTECKMINCTLDGCSINRNSTETYGKITLINNNAIARTTVAPLSPIPFASFTSGAVADFDIQANNTVRRDYISPATAADYVGIKINNADFIDASYRFKPLINDDGVPFAGPGLLAARGAVVAGHEYDLNGDKFGATPAIGCFASHVSTPQKYIPIAGSVAIIGDSFVHGASDRNSLSHVTEAAFPSLNFAKMPGSGFGQTTFYQNHVSIYGGIWSGIHYMALETAATRRCEALIVMGGVNDLNGGADRDDLVAAIIITLDTLNSIGCKVGYAGTQAQSATLGAEVFADSIYVEDQVEAHCIANGYECIKSTSLLTAISGWNADDATGYIDDDDLHPSQVGDAWYASDVMIPLTRSLLIT